MNYHDLSDDEVRDRLRQRGYTLDAAERLIRDRDTEVGDALLEQALSRE